jgi:HPt (histidine-containing phosphotransfer) domain-containing protein
LTGPSGASELLQETIVGELESLEGEALTTLLSFFFDEAVEQISDLRGAVERGDALAVSEMAHKLRGGSSTLGALRVSDIAAELETRAKAGDLTLADELVDRLHNALEETRAAFHSRGAIAHPYGTDQ